MLVFTLDSRNSCVIDVDFIVTRIVTLWIALSKPYKLLENPLIEPKPFKRFCAVASAPLHRELQ